MSNVSPRCPYDPGYTALDLETVKTIMERISWSYLASYKAIGQAYLSKSFIF